MAKAGRRGFSLGERKSVHTDRIILTPGPDSEIALVNRIFRLCEDQGFGSRRIASVLNREGIPGPRGRKWCSHSIDRILTNEKYVRTNVYGRTRGPLKQRRVNTKPSEWVRKEGAFTGIVTKALFDRAQAVIGHIQPACTDEQLIEALKGLFQRKGSLSRRLMLDDPTIAAPETYACRFQGLHNAYRLAGFEPSRRGPPRAELDREALLQMLKTLLAREGRLTKRILETTPGFPGPHVYRWHFGGLRQAYARIDYHPSRATSPVGLRRTDASEVHRSP
jgi:hypothetical protein